MFPQLAYRYSWSSGCAVVAKAARLLSIHLVQNWRAKLFNILPVYGVRVVLLLVWGIIAAGDLEITLILTSKRKGTALRKLPGWKLFCSCTP